MATSDREPDETAEGRWYGLQPWQRIGLLTAGGVAVAGMWAWLGWWLPIALRSEQAERGILGDAFGGVAALFSGLAFLGVIYAILLQISELKLQRREISLNRTQLEGQREALEAQIDAVKQQRFESTLFQMISLHHEIIRSMSVPMALPPLKTGTRLITRSPAVAPRSSAARAEPFEQATLDTPTGREALRVLSRNASVEVNRHVDFGFDPWIFSEEPTVDEIVEAFSAFCIGRETFLEKAGNYLEHYFRNLYHIFRWIDESDIAQKQHYARIARAQLSTDELHLLLYNSFDLGLDKFVPLIHKYDILQHLRPEYRGPKHWHIAAVNIRAGIELVPLTRRP